jgi:2-dehydropantoate 2-reductase
MEQKSISVWHGCHAKFPHRGVLPRVVVWGMKILVVGAGSTGGYFGARLAQAGRDVTFLVRPARAARLREDGLRVISPHGDFSITPQLLTASEITGAFDIILLTVKAFALGPALDDIAPAMGSKTMILPVLNGMKHMDAMIARFGAAPLLGGACKVATTLAPEGRIVQLLPLQELAYGELNGENTPRIRALDSFMQNAGFDARLSPVIEREMWEKWVLLASLGGINCLMRDSIGAVAAAPGGTEFASAFLDECRAIATAAGHPPSAAFDTAARAVLTAPGSSMTSSMYRDLMAGQAVEADQIIGDFLHRAQALGVAAPLLAAAYVNLSIYQTRRAE